MKPPIHIPLINDGATRVVDGSLIDVPILHAGESTLRVDVERALASVAFVGEWLAGEALDADDDDDVAPLLRAGAFALDDARATLLRVLATL